MPFSTGQINFPLFAEKLLATRVASGVNKNLLALVVVLPASLLEAAMADRIRFSICWSILRASLFFSSIALAYLLSFCRMVPNSSSAPVSPRTTDLWPWCSGPTVLP